MRPNPISLAATLGISVKPYCASTAGNPLLISFPPATEMFHFTGFAPTDNGKRITDNGKW